MRRDPPRGLAPVFFVIGCALLALAWAMADPFAASGGLPELSSLRAQRVDDLALWVGCVALATALVWRPAAGSLSLAGLAVAITPSAVELGGAHRDAGLAVVAAIALAAGLLRLAGDRPRPRAWVWLATAASAALLLGPANPGLELGFADAGEAVRLTWEALWPAFAAWIGRVPGVGGELPLLGTIVWTVALLALVLGADRFAGARTRRLLWSAVPVAVVLAALLHAGALDARPAGWFSYAAPVPAAPLARAPLVLLPLALLALLAGDVLARSGAALWPRLAGGCFGLLALVQVLAFTSWRDGGEQGATAWLAAVLAGAVALAAAGAVGATGATPAGPRPRPARG